MTHRILAKILTWVTLLAPLTLFVYRQETVYPLVFLKIFVFQIVVELLVVIWLWLILRYPQYRPTITTIHVAAAIWIGVLILAALTGFNIEKSFWSTQDRSIGIVFILHAFIFGLIVQTVARQFGWRRFMQYLTAIGVFMALMALVNRVSPTMFYVLVGDRPSGTLGNPSFLAGYLLFMLFIGAWLLITKSPTIGPEKEASRWWLKPTLTMLAGGTVIALIRISGADDVLYSIGLGIFAWGLYSLLERTERVSRRWYQFSISLVLLLYIVVLFLANTRGALLGLVAGVIVFLIWHAWKNFHFRNPAVLLLIALVVFSALFISTRSASVWQSIPGFNRLAQLNLSDSTVGSRKIVWGIALEAFKERPLFGWGSDNFRYAFDRNYNPSLMREGSDETYWDKPHNAFLESLATTGIIGFVAYLSIYAAIFWALYRRRNSFTPFGYALVTAYAIQNGVIFDSFATYLMFFISIIFIAENAGEDIHTGGETKSQPISAAVSFGVIAVATILSLWLIRTNSVIIYANALQYQGLNYFVNNRSGDAITAYRKAFGLSYPYSAEIRQSYIASLKQMIGVVTIANPREAIQLALDEFPAAIERDPDNHFLYYTLADARTTFHRVDPKFLSGAIQEIDTADRLSPRRQQIYFIRARIKLALGDTVGAIADIKKAVDLDPQVGEPHFYHAILSVGTATIDEINRELVLALDLGYLPKSLQEMKLLFNYFMLNEQYELGADYFGELSYGNPALVLEQQLYRGELSFKATMFDVARSAFERVKNEFPVFLLTDRFKKDYAQMFQAVGIDG